MSKYVWDENVVWERHNDNIIIIDVDNARHPLTISGELAELWEMCDGGNMMDRAEKSRDGVDFLVKEGWLIESYKAGKSNRCEITMKEEIFVADGVFYKSGYGALISRYDCLLLPGNETQFLDALTRYGNLPLSRLYKKLGFKTLAIFKLFVRKLVKTSLITSNVPFEDVIVKEVRMRVQFDITKNCNLKCKHCYDPRNIMSKHVDNLDTLLNVLDRIFDITKLYGAKLDFGLSGGEPFSCPFIWNILDKIMDNKYLIKWIQILSNGTLINDQIIDRLQKYEINMGIQISLDGLSEKTHDGIRGKGTFKRALDAIRAIRSTSRLGVAMHYVVHKENLEEAYRVLDFGYANHIDRITITRLVPEGNGYEMAGLMLSPQETKDLFMSLAENFNSQKGDGQWKPDLAIDRCDWPVLFTTGEKCTPEYNGYNCQVGKNHLNVRENGDVYPCRRLPIKIGNLVQDNIYDIINHEFLWQARMKTQLGLMKGKCMTCEFATDPKVNYMCSGGATCIAYGVHGDPFLPDPQCAVHL